MVSHPTRVRGLKQYVESLGDCLRYVAPYTGAWIETFPADYVDIYEVSHPTRVRGLKHR